VAFGSQRTKLPVSTAASGSIASARRPRAVNWASSAALISAAGTASPATLSSRTRTQCISTEECQSRLPKNTGVRSLGRTGNSPGPFIRTIT
jgi:hypothetical protein